MNPDLHPSRLRIDSFSYELPEERIAKHPLADRESSKLLMTRYKTPRTAAFREIADLLPPNAFLVFNASKVIPARLRFKSQQQKDIEIFCLEPTSGVEPSASLTGSSPQTWNCLVGNLKAWKEENLVLNKGSWSLQARILQKFPGHVALEFSWDKAAADLKSVLAELGEVPIPPYLNRKSEERDTVEYQTTYAEQEGSVAAPTAGLHFTPGLINSLKEKGLELAYLRLHVGAGTFKPVKAELMSDHDMHSEWMDVGMDTITQLIEAKDRSLYAVGTTSLRSLESLYWMGVKVIRDNATELSTLEIKQWEVYDMSETELSAKEALRALRAWMEKRGIKRLICRTSILIAPPYRLRLVKGLLTNFHQPKSTLLLLVAAIAGERWKELYSYALREDYRFLSYGDAMLLEPHRD